MGLVSTKRMTDSRFRLDADVAGDVCVVRGLRCSLKLMRTLRFSSPRFLGQNREIFPGKLFHLTLNTSTNPTQETGSESEVMANNYILVAQQYRTCCSSPPTLGTPSASRPSRCPDGSSTTSHGRRSLLSRHQCVEDPLSVPRILINTLCRAPIHPFEHQSRAVILRGGLIAHHRRAIRLKPPVLRRCAAESPRGIVVWSPDMSRNFLPHGSRRNEFGRCNELI